MANFCTKCGVPLGNGAKFCQKCGTPIVKAAAQPPQPVQTMANQTAAAASQARSAAAGAMQAPFSNPTGQIASSQPEKAVLGTFGNISDEAASTSEILNPLKALLAGVAAMIFSLIGGFLYRMAQSLTAKKQGASRIANNEKADRLLSGVTYGFALGALVSFIPFGRMPIVLGAACLIVGVMLTIVSGNKKEVAAA